METEITTPVTLFYAGLLGIFYACLMISVFTARHTFKDTRQQTDHPELNAKIRAHANFAENVPFLLLFLLLAELNHIPVMFLHGFGITVVLLRAIHAYGLIPTAIDQHSCAHCL